MAPSMKLDIRLASMLSVDLLTFDILLVWFDFQVLCLPAGGQHGVGGCGRLFQKQRKVG